MNAFVTRHTPARSFFVTVTTIVLSLGAAAVRAEIHPANCAIAQDEVLSAYHEFFNAPKDGLLKRKIATKNAELTECLNTLKPRLTPEIVKELDDAQTIVQTELKYNIETVERVGDAERQPVANMINHSLETKRILGTQKDGTTATTDALRKQAAMMAYMKNRYLERVYSLGGVGLIRESSTELSIEDLVVEFSKKIDALRKDKSLMANPEQHKKLNTVHVRFNFLQKSMMDYNKKAVPFVVVHHSASIIKALLEIADAMEKKPAKAA